MFEKNINKNQGRPNCKVWQLPEKGNRKRKRESYIICRAGLTDSTLPKERRTSEKGNTTKQSNSNKTEHQGRHAQALASI